MEVLNRGIIFYRSFSCLFPSIQKITVCHFGSYRFTGHKLYYEFHIKTKPVPREAAVVRIRSVVFIEILCLEGRWRPCAARAVLHRVDFHLKIKSINLSFLKSLKYQVRFYMRILENYADKVHCSFESHMIIPLKSVQIRFY